MRIVFKTKEEAPQHLQALLKQDGDQWILEGEGADGILTKNQELLNTNRTLKEFHDKFKELGEKATPEQIRKALDEMAQSGQREQEIAKRVKDAVEENERGWKAKETAWGTEKGQLTSALEEHLVDSALTTSIVKADGDPFFVLPKLRNQVKVFNENGKFTVKVLGEDGKPAFGAKGDPMTMDELVGKAKQDKQYSTVFKAPAAAGSGSGNGTGQAGSGKPNGGGAQGVTLTLEQYKNPQAYQAALEQVKGDRSLITITESAQQ